MPNSKTYSTQVHASCQPRTALDVLLNPTPQDIQAIHQGLLNIREGIIQFARFLQRVHHVSLQTRNRKTQAGVWDEQ